MFFPDKIQVPAEMQHRVRSFIYRFATRVLTKVFYNNLILLQSTVFISVQIPQLLQKLYDASRMKNPFRLLVFLYRNKIIFCLSLIFSFFVIISQIIFCLSRIFSFFVIKSLIIFCLCLIFSFFGIKSPIIFC